MAAKLEALDAINIVLNLFAAGGPISQLIDKARSENRNISKEEFQVLKDSDDNAMDELEDAIAKAKTEDR